MVSLETFNTARLTAERVSSKHLHVLRCLWGDPKVMMTWGGLRTDAKMQQVFYRYLDHWEQYGFGAWIFRDRVTDRFVGRGGLRKVKIEGKDEVELLYALMPEFWGQGLATEMAAAIVAIGVERLGLKEIIAYTLPDNRASRRVMEKVGFAYEHNIIHAGRVHVLYRLTPS
jgi:ribosomal-protein-alanine N-acetyltransferase